MHWATSIGEVLEHFSWRGAQCMCIFSQLIEIPQMKKSSSIALWFYPLHRRKHDNHFAVLWNNTISYKSNSLISKSVSGDMDRNLNLSINIISISNNIDISIIIIDMTIIIVSSQGCWWAIQSEYLTSLVKPTIWAEMSLALVSAMSLRNGKK